MSLPIFAAAAALVEFAPMIARWLGGEKGEQVATDVFDVAKRLTGYEDKNQILNTLSANPALLMQFQKEMLQLEAALANAESADRRDARAREISLTQVGHRNFRADIMVVAAAVGLSSCLLCLAFYRESLPGEAVGIISTVAGIFGSCLKDAYAFEFGSSRGSKEKDDRVTAAIMMGRK